MVFRSVVKGINVKQQSVTLVTGASSGLGLEFAKLLAADGHDLVLVARSKEKLEVVAAELAKAHKIDVHIVAADLSDPAAPVSIVEKFAKEQLSVEILINNAGFGDTGPLSKSHLDTQLDMIRVNVVALTELTHRLLPPMLKRRKGKILNVSSTAAFQPGPLMAVYYATKAYVQSFSEAIAQELKDTGVTVTTLSPGPTETGFADRATIGQSSLFRRRLPTAASVARYGYQAMLAGKHTAIPGFWNQLGALVVHLTPRPWLLAAVERIHQSL